MKKVFSIEVIYKLFVILAISVIVFALNNEVFASNDNPTDQPENKIWTNSDDFEIYQFQEAQFLTRINSPKLVQEFLFLCDNSIYIPTITNWNKFVKNYTRFYDAYRAYKQGFNVEFDDILN